MARLLSTESEAVVITSMLFSRILSDELIDMMQALLVLGPLSPSAKLFTADATLHVYKY